MTGKKADDSKNTVTRWPVNSAITEPEPTSASPTEPPRTPTAAPDGTWVDGDSGDEEWEDWSPPSTTASYEAQKAVGARLGPFELQREIGEGSTGVVWRGVHAGQNTPVAVKIMTRPGDDPEAARRRFDSEIRSVAALNHPGIVTVLDFGAVGAKDEHHDIDGLPANAPYIVTEFAQSGTLEDFSRASQRGWPFVRDLLLSLLDALAHAHAREVIHRDVKPSNVLLDRGPRMGDSTLTDLSDSGSDLSVKLTDFGIAFRRSAFSKTPPDGAVSGMGGGSRPVGTPCYMAPEQLRSRWRDYGPWTDLYSLGCMAWQLACGDPPHMGAAPMAVARGHLMDPLPDFSPRFEVPTHFEHWLATLLQKCPEHRYQSAADAAAALEALEPPGTDERQRNQPAECRGADCPTPPRASFPRDWSPDVAPVDIAQVDPDTRHRYAECLPSPVEANREEDAPAAIPPLIRRAPAIPETWKRPSYAQTPMAVVGAGLELFGLREFPLVGRRRVRDRLWEALHGAARERSPRMVLLHGPAGVGKSRLSRWLSRRAREVGAGRALYAEIKPGDRPMEALVRMLRDRLNCEGMGREPMRERLQEWCRRREWAEDFAPRVLDRLVDCLATDENDERPGIRHSRDIFDLLGRLLPRIAGDRPLVLCIDDIQRDLETIDWLQYLLSPTSELSEQPVLLVATYRDESLTDWPAEAAKLEELDERADTEAISLGPMPGPRLRNLLEKGLRLMPNLAYRLITRADGNPLFAIQLVQDWVDRDLLEVTDQGFQLKTEEPMLPDDIHEVWSARLLRHAETDEERRALEVAAALGRTASEREWRATCRALELPFPEACIERLEEARLLEAVPSRGEDRSAGWRFAHSMLRETLERQCRQAEDAPENRADGADGADGADEGLWATYNRICAEVLTDLKEPSDPEIADRLAHHWLAAGDDERALGPLLEAADHNGRLGCFAAAGYLLERAETILDVDDDGSEAAGHGRHHLDVYDLNMGHLRLTQQRLESAAEHLEGVLQRYEDDESPGKEARAAAGRAHLGLGRIAVHNDAPIQAVGHFQTALALAPRQARRLRGRLLHELGIRMRNGAAPADFPNEPTFPTAAAYFKRAADLLADDSIERAKLDCDIAQMRWARGERQRAIDLLEGAVETFHTRRGRNAETYALAMLANLYRRDGRLEEAAETFQHAASISTTSNRTQRVFAEIGLVEVALERENFAQARRLLEVLGADRAYQTPYFAHIHTLYRVAAAAGDHRWPAAEQHLSAVEDAFRDRDALDPDLTHFLRQAADRADADGCSELSERIRGLLPENGSEQ